MSALRSFIVCFFSFATFNATLLAHSPVEFLEVLAVEPEQNVKHAVELKSKFDVAKIETSLEGPQLFSRSVGCLDRPVKEKPAYLNWYKIVEPKNEAIHDVVVLDMIRGSANKSLKIQTAEYFLAPSQLITSGVPDPIPGGLDHYQAFRVIDAPGISKDLTVTSSVGPEKRQLGKPLFVCLPVREWHHDDYVSATHPNDCFVVYELDEQPLVQTFSTIDQFGLNELKSSKNQWLCVRAALLRSPVPH